MKHLFKIVFLFSFCAISAQETKQIAIGPYIQQMSTKDVTLSWSTIEGESLVKHPDGKTDTIREYEQHQIHLANLKPNTTYSYDVLNDGSDEGKGELTTFPDESTPFNFVAIGDSRNRHDIHAEIVSKIMEKTPRFVINSCFSRSNFPYY